MIDVKEGKYYKRRDGMKAGPMLLTMNNTFQFFECPVSGGWYTRYGQYLLGLRSHPYDLVAEWVDETTP